MSPGFQTLYSGRKAYADSQIRKLQQPPSPPPTKLARFSPISVHLFAITYLASRHNLLSTLINLELTLESGLLGECGRADGALERLLLGVDDGVRAQVGRAPEALGCKTYVTSADVLAFPSDTYSI